MPLYLSVQYICGGFGFFWIQCVEDLLYFMKEIVKNFFKAFLGQISSFRICSRMLDNVNHTYTSGLVRLLRRGYKANLGFKTENTSSFNTQSGVYQYNGCMYIIIIMLLFH